MKRKTKPALAPRNFVALAMSKRSGGAGEHRRQKRQAQAQRKEISRQLNERL